jgi:hypothetical protein
MTEDLRYPVGKYSRPTEINQKLVTEWISNIEQFPESVKLAVKGLGEEQLDWRYRPDGWTIRQTIHHCADSHINSLVRFKLTLTEDEPTVKGYHEDKWAELPDSNKAPIDWSISLLDGLHKRWVFLLKSLKEDDWSKVFVHPEHGRKISIGENMALYSWHCIHHLAHIKQAKQYQGKFDS